MHNNNEINYGGFFVRLMAFIIDSIIVGVGLMLFKMPMVFGTLAYGENFLSSPLLFEFSMWDIFLYLLGTAYFVLMTYYCGATLGKKVLNLLVVTKDNEAPSFLTVLYRETIGRYLSSILFIGYFFIIADDKKRALHDILCDTQVVYTVRIPIKRVLINEPQITEQVGEDIAEEI